MKQNASHVKKEILHLIVYIFVYNATKK